jgi:CHAT domain-containing protein
MGRTFDPRLASRLSQSLETVFERAIGLAQRAPDWGWLVARLGYESALRSVHPKLLAEATFTLGVIHNLQDRFEPAMRLLDRAQEMFIQQEDRSGVARCQWQRGVALRFQTHLTSAVAHLESALAEFEALDRPLQVAQVQRDLAIACNLLERFDRAETLINQARSFFEAAGQRVEVARCDLAIGSRLRQRSRYQQALSVLRRAHRAFDEEGQAIDRAKARYLIGLVHIQLQAYEPARSDLEAARTVFLAANLPMRVAFTDMDLGRALWRLGDLGGARHHLEAALGWSEAHHIPYLVADCSLNLGNLHYVRGDYAGAEAAYERALDIYRQLDLKSVAARCQQNLALIHRWRGELSRALDRLHRAVQTLEDEEIPVWAADCHFKIAEIYLMLGQTETAADHTRQAREWYEQEQIPLSRAWCDILDAQIAALADDRGAAIRNLERARSTIASTGSPWHTGLCDRLLGDLLLAQDAAERAVERYDSAQRLFEALGAHVDAAACQVGRGRAHGLRGELAQAERFLSAALDVTAGVLPEWSWQAYAELARVAQAQGEERQALKRYRQAVEALRWVRMALPTAGLAGNLAASKEQIYDQALELALDLQEPEQALEIVEESSALVLMGSLHTRSLQDVEDPYVQRLMTREGNLRAAIAQTRRDLLRAYDQPPDATEKARQRTGALLNTLRQKRSQHLRVLQQLSTTGHTHFDAVEPFTWSRFRDAMAEHLPAPWTALVTHWQDDELLIFHADPDGVEVHRRELGPLERTALEMATATAPERRTLIYDGRMFNSVPGAELGETYRRALYRLLIPAQVSDWLAPDRLLLVVPHGPLHYLPFQTLQSGTRFLAEEAIVSLGPSLGILERLVRRSASPAARGRALLVGLDAFCQDRRDLEWTLREIDRLSTLYGEGSDVLRNADATRGRIQRWSRSGRLDQYSILHFATHGQLDETAGTLSGLSLWEADLVPGDIERLRLTSPLVVLSACQSGLGKVHPGQEVTGLPQAFLTAGARSVTTSLWHIDDRSTIALMEDYHRRVRRGVYPARALAETQRRAIRRGESPYVWGAFLTIGTP